MLHVGGLYHAGGHLRRIPGCEAVGGIQHLQEPVLLLVAWHEVRRDPGAAVAELRPGAARLDYGHPYAELGDLLCDGLAESLYAELGRMVERIGRIGHLSAVGRDLNDPPSALAPHVRDEVADEHDGALQVGRQYPVDLRLRKLLGAAEQSVAGVADQHVYPVVLPEGHADGVVHRGDVGHVQHHDVEGVRILLREVLDLLRVPDRPYDGVAPLQKLLGHLPAEAAGDACYEPCPCHIPYLPFIWTRSTRRCPSEGSRDGPLRWSRTAPAWDGRPSPPSRPSSCP